MTINEREDKAVDAEWISVRGRVVPGLRAASGLSRKPDRGTIELQLPFFRAAIPRFDDLFDRRPRLGTLNVKIRGRRVRVLRPAYFVSAVPWSRGDPPENFYLSPCRLIFAGEVYRGLIYIPDPATKPAGLPTGHVLEVLTSRVPRIRYRSPVRLQYPSDAIVLERGTRRRAAPGPRPRFFRTRAG